MKTTPSSVSRSQHFAVVLISVILFAMRLPSHAEPHAAAAKGTKAVSYDAAVTQLKSHLTWCQGAKRLAQLADRRALIPLLTAYEIPIETSKLCLMVAMKALGPTDGARELYQSGQAAERRLAVLLMELFPNEEFLPILAKAVADVDSPVRAQARHSLAGQVQSAKWELLLIHLLDTADEEGRAQAIESLSHRHGETVRKMLAARLTLEPSAALREKLEKALSTAK